MRKYLYLLSIPLLLLMGCKKETEIVPPEEDRSPLHIVNAVQGTDTFNLRFDYFNTDDLVITKLFYQKSWPENGYAQLLAAGTPDEFGHGKLWILGTKNDDVIGLDLDTVMTPRSIILEKDQKNTLCMADSSGSIVPVLLQDNFAVPVDTVCNVRFINLKESTTAYSLNSTDLTIGLSGVSFLNGSTFMNFPAGTYDLEVTEDGTGTLMASATGFVLQGGKTYTFYISGTQLTAFTH